MTPGQAAYEAFATVVLREEPSAGTASWQGVNEQRRAAWEAAAQAAIAAAPACPECDSLRREVIKFGELVTEILNAFSIAIQCDETPEMEARLAEWCDRALAISQDGVPAAPVPPLVERLEEQVRDLNAQLAKGAEVIAGLRERDEWNVRLLNESTDETAVLRARMAAAADALDASAAVTAPSKKSEIEREAARRIRAALDGTP